MTQLQLIETPILAAHQWSTNAELINDMHRLGYLQDTDHVVDPTYGYGKFWTAWQPATLTASDIDPTKTPTEPIDFRQLPYDNNTFDAAVFDPPYMAPGGRKRSTIADFNDRYGTHTTPRTPAENQQSIHDGFDELVRVVKPRGFVLVKCMDYVNSGKLWAGTHHLINHADEIGAEYFDRIDHIGRPGPQPPRRRQVHARRNLSTLLVFKVPR